MLITGFSEAKLGNVQGEYKQTLVKERLRGSLTSVFLPHPVVLVGLLDTCSNPSVGVLLILVSNQEVFFE